MSKSAQALPRNDVSALGALQELIRAVSQSLDLDDVINASLDKIMELFHCHSTHIRLIDHQSNELVTIAQRGLSAGDLAKVVKRRQQGEGSSAMPIESGEALIVEDIDADPRYAGRNGFVRRIGCRSFVYLPLFSKDKNVGSLSIRYRDPHIYAAEEIKLFTAIGHLIGTAIENARMYRERSEQVKEIDAILKRLEEKNAREQRLRQQLEGELLISEERLRKQREAEAEMKIAREAAEEATKVKSAFLANMSHEIRTPMNAIVGLSHLLSLTNLDGKQQDYLNKIEDSAHLLLGIINDILDFSKLEANKLAIETVAFNLEDILANNASVLGPAAYKKGIELLFYIAPDVPVLLCGDPLRLGQVVINLANNAIKFTNQGEVVVRVELLSLSTAEKNSRALLKFSVQDTGVGMSGEQQTKLFQSFSQADASITRRYGGTGLGLAISKNLISLMGGEIGVESVFGLGSTFFFTLPFAVQESPAAGDWKNTIVDVRGRKALIIDDNDTSRDILTAYLNAFGFIIQTASSGEEALEKLRERRNEAPDVVLVDWRMPGMDGVETIRQMRVELPSGKSLMVIMVSAYDLDDIKKEAGANDINGFLAKPINQSYLFDTLMNVFSSNATPTTRLVASSPLPGSIDGLSGCRVLLAEDNAINQQVATELLERVGIEVDVANNGQEAIEKISEKQYDCVLMDIQMPEMDGYEATRIIRSMDGLEQLPIIAMTAHALAGDRELSLAAGMNDHTSKPINPGLLYATLQRWIGSGEGKVIVPADRPVRPADMFTLPEHLPGIDWEEGLKRVAGNRTLFAKIVIEFCESFADAPQQVAACLELGDRVRAERIVHSIKGAAGNIGAVLLHQTAGNLEKALKEMPAAVPPALAEAFGQAMGKVIAAGKLLKEAMPTVAPREPEEYTAIGPDLRPFFQGLADKLQENSFEAGDVFAAIVAQMKDSAGPQISQLGREIDNYEFENALATLQAVLQNTAGGDNENYSDCR